MECNASIKSKIVYDEKHLNRDIACSEVVPFLHLLLPQFLRTFYHLFCIMYLPLAFLPPFDAIVFFKKWNQYILYL